MSLILHCPKAHLSHGTKVELVAKFLGIDLEFNRISPAEWKSPEHLKRHPLGKVPVLETPEGCIYESLSIVRYLARRAGKLYGATAAETAHIDQWLEFTNTQLQPYLATILYPLLGYAQTTAEKFEEGRKGLLEVLKIIDSHLEKSEFLGSKSLSVADIVVSVQLRYIFSWILDEPARSGLPSLTKWFVNLMENEHIKAYFGKTWLCQKVFVPDYTFAPKKKEEPKKEEKKEVKKEQPKKEKKEEVEETNPFEEKKKKNPLDSLPKSTFVIDDFKRDFVNAEDRAEAWKRFWTSYDPEGWSLWQYEYEMGEGEGKVGYLTCNLKNGFLRNLDHFRKYAFGVIGVYGVVEDEANDKGNFVIQGTMLWRGTEVPEEWKEHNAYDYSKFIRLDHTKEADRQLIEDSWNFVNDSDGLYQGRPIYEAKWFK